MRRIVAESKQGRQLITTLARPLAYRVPVPVHAGTKEAARRLRQMERAKAKAARG